MHGRSYPREFKLDAVRQAHTGAKGPSQVCREHGIPRASCCAGVVSTRRAARKRFCHDNPRARKPLKPGSPSWSGIVVSFPSNSLWQKKP